MIPLNRNLPKSIENQLLSLSLTEKVEALQILAKSINHNWRGISKTSQICGGDACIEGTRIPVWLLIADLRAGVSEADLLDDYPTISAADLVNVWAYGEANPDEIALAIQQHEDA